MNDATNIAVTDHAANLRAFDGIHSPAGTMRGTGSRVIEAAFVSRTELAAMSDRWRDLAHNAVEYNPFYAPHLLSPALDHLNSENVQIACVFEPAGGDQRLIGVAPFTVEKSYARLPITILKNWMHEHCFFGAPLVRRGYALEFFDSLFRLIEKHPARPALMRFSHMRLDGPLLSALNSQAKSVDRYAWRTDQYTRAQLNGPINADEHFTRTLRKKKRKEINRLRNRLSEIGQISFSRLNERKNITEWSELFLTLEARGWKGAAESALASSGGAASFFKKAVEGAFDADALRFYRLDVGERTIAMIVNFLGNGEGYSFKICHDEEFSRFSPGVLLELEMLNAVELEPGFKFYDSCATENHPMINCLWRDRAQIGGVNVGRSGARAGVFLRAIRALEVLSAQYRSLVADPTKARQ